MGVKQNYKLTDEQFIEALRENNGILANVARWIQRKYGITYTRQSVHERAHKFAYELKEIRESVMDYSECRLIKYISDDDCDARLSTKIAVYFLDSLGKDRGYGKNGIDKILTRKPEQEAGIRAKSVGI